MDQSQNANYPDPVTTSGDSPTDAAPPPPMTPVAWLLNNGIYLVVLGALLAWLLHKYGVEGLWQVALTVFGLGFLIFVHELGHFLTAKWCDVHVQTFSIGFGPALPGCSFQRGETTYKIGVIPLGGYVNMVGEGPEADEDENYPRSFKNKTVGQRMLIISAGVIMNVIVGGLLFVFVYMYHGDYRPAGIVGAVDPGSPAWENGVRSGMAITHLDGISKPYFDDLRIAVVLSSAGERIPFTFQTPGSNEPPLKVDLLPRRAESDPNPVIGVSAPEQLKLPADPKRKTALLPVVAGSAAAAARPLGLQRGDVVLATTDPDHPDQLLSLPSADYAELGRRLKRLVGQNLVLRVRPAGAAADKAEEHVVPVEGFAWGDRIVGTSKPPAPGDAAPGRGGAPYDPFVIEELPRDPRHPREERYDPFAFHDRLVRLVGRPMVIRVRREGESAGAPPVDLFVPPAYHYTFGMRMKMGAVAALRDGSPAVQVGLQRGDLLVKIALQDAAGKVLREFTDLDPERLPDQLRMEAGRHPGPKKVALTVRRPSGSPQEITLPAAAWDESWTDDIEVPLSQGAPLSIPQIGLAYRVESRIVHVKEGGPAARAGLKKEDRIDELRYRTWSSNYQDTTWSNWQELGIPRNGEKVYDGWARVLYTLQGMDHKTVEMKVDRPDPKDKSPGEPTVTAEEDESWPLVDRGLRLQSDYDMQKADSFVQALSMGAHKTGRMIVLLYQQLRSLATGRVSFKQVGGPGELLVQGFATAGSGIYDFLLFLGIISINLAVVNFLPIPVLDGGHMVFLIYEKLRGRPPSETVRVIATYIGLAAIGSLMIFVLGNDFIKHIKWW